MPRSRHPYGIVAAVPAYGDIGAVEGMVIRHRYLDCYECGEQLHHGESTEGAPLYVCMRCKMLCDKRRVP